MEHLLCVFLLTSLMTSAFVVTEVVNMNATVGKDCVLPCVRPEGRVDALQWTQSGLAKPLLTYRNNQTEGNNDESSKNRVKLQDPDLKNGDLSLILKNVTLEDSGDYRCVGYVKTTTGRSKRNTVEVINHNIHLSVSEPSQKDTSVNDPPLTDRNTAVAVVVPVFIIFVLLGAGIVFWKRKEIKQWQALKRSPEEC